MARTLYGRYMSAEEPQTPEEIAEDWDLPLEAVREAIAYCQSNPPEIALDQAEEEALLQAHRRIKDGKDPERRSISPQERARIHRQFRP